ncbi:MAG: hypothetical protein A3J75_05460 [Acidobacteria bacterium RBG_16_68_9]|nr:MAG: hypothetical protein A3J75_05460 [Acidobacteria bacterium RBG_16_68_9]
MGRASLKFAVGCGLLGEAVELLVLSTGGMSPPDWRLRATLVAVYAMSGGLLWMIVALLGRDSRRRLAWATGLFGALLVIPWLNFDYLPQLLTVRTVLGNLVAVAVLSLLAVSIARFPRLAAVAVAVLALGVNSAILRGRSRLPVEHQARHPAGPAAHVVLVVIDTLRADHLSVYGARWRTSPELDRLAAGGVVFDRAVSQATYTKPAIASLFTGTYVHRHGVISSRDALGRELPTLAEALRAQGYRTAAFSSNPWITPEFHFERGFEHFTSSRAIDMQLTVLYRLFRRVGAGLKAVGVEANLTGWLLRAPAEANPSNAERDERLATAVIDWVRGHAEQPFFLYVHFIGPHDPYDPPAEYARRFRQPGWNGTPGPLKPPARVLSIFETAPALDDRDREMMVAQYNGAIAYADAQLGRVVAELERLDVLDHTLLIVTADHGEEFYEHGNWGHGVRLYDEIVRVPLVVRLPGRLAPARRSDPAMLIDVFPSIFGILDLPLRDPQLSGRDLFADVETPAPPAFSEYFSVEAGSYESRMVMHGGFKFVETQDGARDQYRRELFDLQADPREQRNLLATGDASRVPVSARALEGLLADFKRAAPAGRAPEVEVDGATKEALRALGY